ncbi:MAG: hypothetical protein HY748_10720 [Elusimicrobia bacterium]|nr:hypothetical protein [Elusimicrobiota bacterium]
MTIGPGGKVSADGKGFGPGQGPGAGAPGTSDENRSGGGGGYGGLGGVFGGAPTGSQSGSVYGSLVEPAELGSGGGNGYYGQTNTPGGPGGGTLRITVSGELRVDGAVTANGVGSSQGWFGGSSGGCGSGGSVLIRAGALAGSGLIAADGGSKIVGGDSPGGGGGRVAVYASTASFTGWMSAYGGSPKGPAAYGGAGTVVIGGTLAADNNGHAGSETPLPPGAHEFGEVESRRKAVLRLPAQATLTYVDLYVREGGKLVNAGTLAGSPGSKVVLESGGEIEHNGGTFTAGELTAASTFYNNAPLTAASLTVSAGGMFYLNTTLRIPSVSILEGGILTHAEADPDFDLMVTGDMEVRPGGRVSADGKGYAGGQGPGAGANGINDENRSGGGGGYGGLGGGFLGSRSGGVYGSLVEPTGFGSGGGNGQFGSIYTPGAPGGGALRITVSGELRVDGGLTANGGARTKVYFGGSSGGGGSGGSVFIRAGSLTGSGFIAADGGTKFGVSDGGGGGGGRVAVYASASSFTGLMAARGGAGSSSYWYPSGKPGTVVENGLVKTAPSSDPDSPVTISPSSATITSFSAMTETLLAQNTSLRNLASTGTLQGTVNFENFDLVTLKTGPFAGRGFAQGRWSALLDNIAYEGQWKGMAYLKEGRLHLKAVTEGGLRGVLDGTLRESAAGSGIFDRFEASWAFGQLGSAARSGKLSLSGAAAYGPSQEHPLTQLKLLQAGVEGAMAGYHAGPVNAVVTLLRISQPGHPFNGAGFCGISHVTGLGSGQAWAYAEEPAAGNVVMSGLSDQPFYGLMQAALNENLSPKALTISLERVDAGIAPEPDLKLKSLAPQRVSAGETVSYSVELRNDGLKAAEDMSVVAVLTRHAGFVSASGDYKLADGAHWIGGTYSPVPFVRWDLPRFPPRTSLTLNYQAKIGLAGPHEMLDAHVHLIRKTSADQVLPVFDPAGGHD